MNTLAPDWLFSLKQTTGRRPGVVWRVVASLAFLCTTAQAAVSMPATRALAGGEPPIVVDHRPWPMKPSRSALARLQPECLPAANDASESRLSDRRPACADVRADAVNPQPLPPRGHSVTVAVNPQPLPPIHDRRDVPSSRHVAVSRGYIGETEKRIG